MLRLFVWLVVGLSPWVAASQRARQQDPSQTSPAAPAVTISQGTNISVAITGTSLHGVNSYHGVPYAAPPIGELRFQPPQDVQWNDTTWNASAHVPVCIQQEDPLYTTGYGTSEDCLYLSILTPAVLPDEPIPVMIWWSTTFANGSWLVSQSIETDRPVIYVAASYRLGYLGFPFGAEAHAAGATNLGRRDMIKALEWTRDNIAAFGGDVGRVTAFGESAGSISVALMYLRPDLDLFQGAIMQSGSQSTAPVVTAGEAWLEAYDLLLELSGCNNTTISGFACLKTLPAEDLLAAQVQVRNDTRFKLPLIFAPSINGDLIPASPYDLLANGSFAKVPYINGGMRDEGTLFIPSPAPNGTAEAVSSFGTLEPEPPAPGVLEELFTEVYPDVPAAGSPFGTGNETFGLPSTARQFAAVFGDCTFQAPRRWFFQQSLQHYLIDTWSYQVYATLPTLPPILGAAHSFDLMYTTGDVQLARSNDTGARAEWARSYKNFTEADAALSRTMIDYWINFAHFSDPNGVAALPGSSPPVPAWPRYGDKKSILDLSTDSVEVSPDTSREEQIQWFLDQPKDFHY